MLKDNLDNGDIRYRLTKLDVLNIVIAHIERGGGKLVAGGNYSATVTFDADEAAITITPKEKPQ